ncbi:hypothetical protein MSAN_00612700 [Mycena sanguinolenta]|uniref:Uncharacterized protein n=1 Tax=Mycena sanguinolenta TaxID=230812 RepID=A0A8H7DEA8_9AGAR|nr:hypothetical protein MSAN_00612700 [Mycena sanguinolenta]
MPSALLLMSCIFALIDITCTAYQYRSGGVDSLPGREAACVNPALISWACSLATNIICTLLIGLKAWQHRKIVRDLCYPVNRRGLSSEKIFFFLIESGSLYGLLWVKEKSANLLLIMVHISGYSLYYVPKLSPDFARVILLDGFSKPMSNQLVGMYPTLIILIVNFRFTIWEEDESSAAVWDNRHTAPGTRMKPFNSAMRPNHPPNRKNDRRH